MSILNALAGKMGDFEPDGDEYNFECPRCSTGKRKLGVNLRRGKFNCFKCHWGGNLRDLLDYLGIDVRDFLAPRPAQKEVVRASTPTEIPGFRLIGTDPGAEIERDILRMCQERASLSRGAVRARGWGWSDDKYLFGRLILPVRMHGQLVQYLARAVYPGVEPKEKCGPTGLGWWNKTSVLYGFDAIPQEPEQLVLVEGMWDYEAILRTPVTTPLSLMGTQLGDIALGAVLGKRPKRIVLLFDGDEAGARATVHIAQRIRTRHYTDIYVARPPLGSDPDELDSPDLYKLVKHSSPYFSWLLANPSAKAFLKADKRFRTVRSD